MRRLALAFGLGSCAAPEAGAPLDPTTLWTPVPPLERALTFARRAGANAPELLLVLSVADGRAEAVALPEADDPITPLERTDAAALRRAAGERTRVSVPLAELGLPAALAEVHIAAGTNFPEHGDEVGVDEPFLFPKPVAPTPWASPVCAAARLDFEVELCFVALRPLASEGDVPGRFGVLLCNDFTDRWTLVKGMLGPGEMAPVASRTRRAGPASSRWAPSWSCRTTSRLSSRA
jgi:hypothetical protein